MTEATLPVSGIGDPQSAITAAVELLRGHGFRVVKVRGVKVKAAPSERGVAFAEWFRGTLDAKMALPAGWRESWAREFDLLIAEGRTEKEIATVCAWARADEFWRANFLSPRKLRQRDPAKVMYFDRFAAKLAGGRAGTGRRQPSRGYEIKEGKGPQAVSALEILKADTGKRIPESGEGAR